MRKTLLVLGVGLAGVVVGALGATYVGAQAAKMSRTELVRKPLSGVEGKEVVLFVADFPAGVAAGRHGHPGDEAMYVVQGSIVVEPDGGQPIQLKAGQATLNPAKKIHNVKNPSSSEPAKLLNCLVAEKGGALASPAP